VGGLVVHDDDLGEVRIAGERREASGEAPFFILSGTTALIECLAFGLGDVIGGRYRRPRASGRVSASAAASWQE
jgi:hypothetical protein